MAPGGGEVGAGPRRGARESNSEKIAQFLKTFFVQHLFTISPQVKNQDSVLPLKFNQHRLPD